MNFRQTVKSVFRKFPELEKFYYMLRFVKKQPFPFLFAISAASLCWTNERDIANAIFVGVLTFWLFQGYEYACIMLKWRIYFSVISLQISFFGIVSSLIFKRYPIKLLHDTDDISQFIELSKNLPDYGLKFSLNEFFVREKQFVTKHIAFVDYARKLPTTEMLISHADVLYFVNNLRNSMSSIETALDIVVNVNADEDKMIFVISALLESCRIFSCCVNEQQICVCSPKYFLDNLFELLSAYRTCVATLLEKQKELA